MDNQEHERSSSSPSVSISGIAQRRKGRQGEELEVTLSDASSFFAALRIWEQSPFHEGDVLTPQRIHQIRSDSRRLAITARALDLLARSDHSRFLLTQKLRLKLRQPGSALTGPTTEPLDDESIIEKVMDELVAQGALDDRRYAENWIRSRIRRHPEGVSYLVAGLRQRGVSAEIARASVGAVLNDDTVSLMDAARRVAGAAMRKSGASPERLAAVLYRRGFRRDIVRAMLDEYAGDFAEDIAEDSVGDSVGDADDFA